MSNFKKNPWSWISTLYYTQGLPYVVVMTVSVIMYKNLGYSNTEIAFYTSLLNLPWVVKPLWSPLVDMVRTKRWWTYTSQAVIAVGFAGVALSLYTESFFTVSMVFLFVLAFSSATHDIAADGFYMLALSDDRQAFFVGIRSTFYRLAIMSGEGLFVVIAGIIASSTGNVEFSWVVVFSILSVLMLLLSAYHAFILPKPIGDISEKTSADSTLLKDFFLTFALFFKKKQIGLILSFILLYRFSEAQLVKLAVPFLLDDKAIGGLGLSTTEIGVINGSVGVLALVVGGIVGGILISRDGLKKWLWPMIIAMNLPNAAYLFLAYFQPDSYFIIGSLVGIEKFGYGFGFTAFMMYLIYVAKGSHQTAHYAFATGLMALGMMIPGAFSGWIQEMLGYKLFFIWILIATIPSFVIARYVKIDADFGKKLDAE
ncbi:MAG: MFS transporter [Balneolaceae bacterium]